jgi:hypothetical protein
MDYQDYLHDAIDVVLDWDLPDEAVSDAALPLAAYMAGELA